MGVVAGALRPRIPEEGQENLQFEINRRRSQKGRKGQGRGRRRKGGD